MQKNDGEPVVTIIFSEHEYFLEGDTLSLSAANRLFEVLDEEKLAEPLYYKTKFRIDFIMDGKAGHYEGRQELGDGEGSLIEHIEKENAFYVNNKEWADFLLQHKGKEALEADLEVRDTVLNELVPYFKLHCNLSKMEQAAKAAMQRSENMPAEETAYYIALLQYVSESRRLINQGKYDLQPVPQFEDYKMQETKAYKEQVKAEVEQEAASAGMTVEEYAINGYAPFDKYYPIDEAAARRANDANSFSDYREGSATAVYRQYVDEAVQIAEKQKARTAPRYHEKIDHLLDTYARKLAENMNNRFAIEARVPSILITGGGNFPVRNKEKQNAARDRNSSERQNIERLLDKIRSTGMGGISADDPQAIQKLEDKLAKLIQSQEIMKTANAYYRKYKTLDGYPDLSKENIEKIKRDMSKSWHLEDKPFPAWALSNNNAEIRRVKNRIQELSQKQTAGFVGWEFEGGKAEINTEANRIQLFFDEKPDADMRTELKSNGFRWAPSIKAWQRQLNDNAIRAADRIRCIQPLTGERPTELQKQVRQKNVVEKQNQEQVQEVSQPAEVIEKYKDTKLKSSRKDIRMENIVENVKGIMESIHLSQDRIEKGTLSQKDQKNMIEMIGEAIEGINNRKDLQDNDKVTQLKEHLGNIQDAFVSHDPAEIISEQKAVSQITDQLSQEITKGNLIRGIFQNDMQIMELENEKAELAQQLIDLDMQAQGEISDITRQVLEANHINLDAGDNGQKEQATDQQMEGVEKEATPILVGTVYLSGTQTNRENFYGKDLEAILNEIRSQQEKPNSSMAKVKTVYIKQQGTNGTSLKYDIASGKDITPIYLKLPFAGREEFKRMTTYLKENGAVFNPHKKEWYVTREQDLSKFKAYLPAGISVADDVDKAVQEVTDSPMKQAEKLINHIEENKTVFSNDERNLIMNYAYHIKDMDKVEKLANELVTEKYGFMDFLKIEERINKEIELQQEGEQPDKTEAGMSSEDKEEKDVLYGVEVSVDHSLHSDGYKVITQEVFDEIMTKRADSLAMRNTEMEKLDFSGCWFQNVTFDGKETGLVKNFIFNHSKFSDCQFDRIQFENSSFQDVHIFGCELKKSEFSNCDFSKSTIGQTRDHNSTFAWCDFSNAVFRKGAFTQSVFGNPNFDGAVMDGTGFFDTTVSEPSMNNITLTMSGASFAEISAYTDRIKEAFQWYDKSLKANKPLSAGATVKENSPNIGRKENAYSGGKPPTTNSIMRKLNENKVRADEFNKQKQPHGLHKETEAVK